MDNIFDTETFKNSALLKIRNNYTVVENLEEEERIQQAENDYSLKGVTYIKFSEEEDWIDKYDRRHEGGLKVQLRHGDGETLLSELPSFTYSNKGLMFGDTLITNDILDKIVSEEAKLSPTIKTIVLADNLTFTVPFGRFGSTDETTKTQLTNEGKYTIITRVQDQETQLERDMTLSELFEAAFATDTMPKITQPNCTVTLTNFTSYEVGTSITASYKFSPTAGEYQYGPETEVQWRDFKANLKGNTATGETFTGTAKTGLSGSFSVEIKDGTSLKFIGEAIHDGSPNTPNTALKEGQYIAGRIKKLDSPKEISPSNTISGYRKCFMGTLSDLDTPLTSNMIRNSLANAYNGKVEKKDWTWTTQTPGARRLIIAVPTAYKVTKVLDKNDSNTDIVKSFELLPETIQVDGAKSGTGMAYSVYVLSSGSALKTNTYTVTIA